MFETSTKRTTKYPKELLSDGKNGEKKKKTFYIVLEKKIMDNREFAPDFCLFLFSVTIFPRCAKMHLY